MKIRRTTTPLLFREPLTAEQSQHLRESFAETKPAASSPTKTINPITSLFTAWQSSPLKIGILIYANLLALTLLIKALIS